jgi:hypothetical protein
VSEEASVTFSKRGADDWRSNRSEQEGKEAAEIDRESELPEDICIALTGHKRREASQ